VIRKRSQYGRVTMRTDTPGRDARRRQPLPAQAGERMTADVQPLLHEIRYALVHLSELGEDTVIDLRNISQPHNSTIQE